MSLPERGEQKRIFIVAGCGAIRELLRLCPGRIHRTMAKRAIDTADSFRVFREKQTKILSLLLHDAGLRKLSFGKASENAWRRLAR